MFSTPGDPALAASSRYASHIIRMASAHVCHPLAISPPKTDFFAASSSTWNGCGSYSRAKRTMSSFDNVLAPNSRTGLVRRYEERTGRAVGAALFYYVFALFKIAVIVQQIYKRYVEGHTHDPRFAALMGWVRVVASQAARAMERGRIDRLGRIQ